MYQSKTDAELSWTEQTPALSLELLEAYSSKEFPVVDIGGGRSHLVDEILARGWSEVTVLDLSSVALDVVGKRHSGDLRLHLVDSDVTEWEPTMHFGTWHDRAVLHFLTNAADQAAYVERVAGALSPGGVAVIGCFSPTGPESCSGLPVVRRSADELSALFGEAFDLVTSRETAHETPWGTRQDFVWVVLRRRTTAS